MSLWEYKVITSGKGGFATPALLEKFLNDLGREEWEIIHFHTPPDNFLAFTGLARRSTQRDWTLEDAAAAAAKAEAEKLRAEFEAKFKAASGAPAGTAEERAPSFLEEKVAPDDGFRKPVDTSHDADADVDEEEAKADEWDKLTAAEEEELPTFFEAIKPHMRRNQRGPGMSVGVDYLAKKWDQAEEDLKGALVECGFEIPSDEDAKPVYLEYDGDLYWVNVNRRGELWINTKEKPRPVFRPIKAPRVEVEAPPPREGGGSREKDSREKDESRSEQRADAGDRRPEGAESAGEKSESEPSAGRGQKAETPVVPLPAGPALLDKIRPHMRRNRRGPGGSGSASFLSRALRTNETELRAAFAGLGLTIPATANDKAVYTEFGNELWWLNLDSRGGLWINGREKRPGETAAAATAAEPAPSAATGDAAPAPEPGATTADAGATPPPLEAAPASAAIEGVPAPEIAPSAAASEIAPAAPSAAGDAPSRLGTPSGSAPIPGSEAPGGGNLLSAVRLHLKETKTGGVAAKVDRLAEELAKPAEEFLASLVGAGLKVPEKPREKPVYVEHGGEILWLAKNSRGELWLNAKASKFADRPDEDEEADEGDEAGEASETGDGERRGGRRGRGRTKKPEGSA